MNRQELARNRFENLNKLDESYRPKFNAIELDVNNSIEHELAKFICVWLIRNGVPANILPQIITRHFKIRMNSMGLEGDFFGTIKGWSDFKHEWERPVVVTEARFKPKAFEYATWEHEPAILEDFKPEDYKTRRADIFILDTGEIVEIETNPKVTKEGAITVRI